MDFPNEAMNLAFELAISLQKMVKMVFTLSMEA